MKYTVEVTIDVSRDRLSELLDNSDNLLKWQSELKSFEHVSGEPGQVGAKSKLVYVMGKKQRRYEMVETITKRDFPREFSASYDSQGMVNHVSNEFQVVDENRTKWVAHNDCELSGFMKVIGWLAPGMFKKQTTQFMNQFKEFAESEGSRSDPSTSNVDPD